MKKPVPIIGIAALAGAALIAFYYGLHQSSATPDQTLRPTVAPREPGILRYPPGAPQLSAAAGKMEKCNFCQTPGKVRPLGMPRACEEICPTGAIQSGPMTALATQGRMKAAGKAAGMAPGLPSIVLDAQQRFGVSS